jgi:DEAD/DEAH box helicase domain-containing protein
VNLAQILDQLQSDPGFMAQVACWRILPPREARYAPLPARLDLRLVAALSGRGISQLYTHQARAIEAVLEGKNVAVVTPTASGKTYCYNLPVIQSILHDPSSRALYLFPTKALSQDQLAELQALTRAAGADIKSSTYDGDTPSAARQAIRKAGHIVITNPDMLHTGILPHHTRWVRLFENLRYVVIDELHTYRGVFGSHVANVIRRLKRVCAHYGANPQFICASATIANPRELAERLVEAPFALVDDNGAPAGEKHLILYNPPVVNREIGLRANALLEARKVASLFLKNDVQTICFTRTRTSCELLTTYLRQLFPTPRNSPDIVRGYRGGYLPNERREIERGLREGRVRGVVSTNALELGIDIGALEAAILLGYPGSIASAWQQAGRAGRRQGVSAAVIVATSNPLDQFIVNNPEYLFERSPEHGLINPDNAQIFASHLKCAAFELFFEQPATYGNQPVVAGLEHFEQLGIVHHNADRWYWAAETFPANEVSLRSAETDNVVIIDTSGGKTRVIGEIDTFSAPMLVHEEAIYLHETRQYQVEKLDWPEKKAFVREVDVDYYTDASLDFNLQVLREEETHPTPLLARSLGEVLISAKPHIYKKIKMGTHENVGWGYIHLPEQELATSSVWFVLAPPLYQGLTWEERESALVGLARAIVNVAPLFLMCDPHDIGVLPQVNADFTKAPTVFVYDSYPGGVGLSDKLYALRDTLFQSAAELVRGCICRAGCPSCVGPAEGLGPHAKRGTLRLLEQITGRRATALTPAP